MEEQLAGFELYRSAYFELHQSSGLLQAALPSLVVGRQVQALAEFVPEHQLDCLSLAEGAEASAPFELERKPEQEFAVAAEWLPDSEQVWQPARAAELPHFAGTKWALAGSVPELHSGFAEPVEEPIVVIAGQRVVLS